VDGWYPEDSDGIGAGRRRMRTGKRRPQRRGFGWGAALLVVAVVGALVAGGYYWLSQSDEPQGPTQAIVASGGFQASIGNDQTITVGLEIRNVSDAPVTVVAARIVAPAGLTSVGIALAATDDANSAFDLTGDLPASTAIELGTEAAERNAIIAARFTVDCAGLLATDAPLGEQIFVVVKQGSTQREEELTPPVVGDVPWLAATARRVCLDPVTTDVPEQPLPPLPDGEVTPTTNGTPG